MYENWDMSSYPSHETFRASINKIDAQLGANLFQWALTEAARNANGTDWKPVRVAENREKIERGESIVPPEFYLSPNGTAALIMDGRHRLYALHEAGYEHVLVQCKPEERERLQRIIGL